MTSKGKAYCEMKLLNCWGAPRLGVGGFGGDCGMIVCGDEGVWLGNPGRRILTPAANCGFASFIASATAVAVWLLLFVPFAIPGTDGPFVDDLVTEPLTVLTPFATGTGLDARTWTGGLPGVSGMTRFDVPVLEIKGVVGGELANSTSFVSAISTFCRFGGGGVCCDIVREKAKNEGYGCEWGEAKERDLFPSAKQRWWLFFNLRHLF